MILRDYQQKLADEVEAEWADGKRVVLMQLETGGGKTPILARLIADTTGHIAALAHRDKLVEQISLTLARAGVPHDLIASDKTKRIIARKHVTKLGRCFYQPGARVRVASAQTLAKAKQPRDAAILAWAAQVTLWIVDEGHHLIRDNMWGRCVALFTHPSCRGLIVTATPGRPDGKGLGRHADGYADVMVEGPPMRWLIDQGYLCDYRVKVPPGGIRATEAPRGADGDFTQAQRAEHERNNPQIVGNVVKHYLGWAAGKSGITFCGSIEKATETLAAFRAAGVTAELITGDTDPNLRDAIFDRAERGELNEIIAVDVISEGVDIPALLVGSFERLTGSLIVWRQQLGRLLRPMMTALYKAATTREERLAAIAASPKPYALLLDHIGGFINPQLGPPDRVIEWTLDRRDSRASKQDDDVIPQRTCLRPESPEWPIGCYEPYPRVFKICPHCKWAHVPASRAAPEYVDGVLGELDPAALAVLRGAIEYADRSIDDERARLVATRLHHVGVMAGVNRHAEALETRQMLRAAMAAWGGVHHADGETDEQIQARWYFAFGIDVGTAQTLRRAETQALLERVLKKCE